MKIIKDVFTDQNFLGAVISSIAFILIGFLLRRSQIIQEKGREVINAIVMWVAIPCMAFVAFMSDFKEEEFLSNIIILLLDLFFYVVVLAIANLCFLKSENRRIYAILIAVGQLTFFSIPLLSSIYADHLSEVLIPGSMMTLPFRFITYLYAYLVISATKISKKTFGKTMKNIFLTPIMICMLAGFLVWVTQNVTWQVHTKEGSFGFLRIDKTLPALYQIFRFGNSMATPICMLLMGVTLGEADFLKALKNTTAWIIALSRSLLVPLFILGFCLLLQALGWFNFTEYQLAALVIGNAAPVGAVVSVYCGKYNKEGYLASDTVFLSTFLCVLSIPLCLILIRLSLQLAIFA